ncbi:ABC transporter ATP binding protein [Caballeronia arationis]|uniref:ABC transporter ATP-binding protein n=1 Tax=Caballeronia arationis TaxID=1777142 RepID=UPI00074CEBDB|nr:ABC transporter ATP-binding protein [Caballeronia arationis]SAK89247.1 ABC transporter ATP binding protein [Caballeronia arationis]
MSVGHIWYTRWSPDRRKAASDPGVEALGAFARRPVSLLLRYIARHGLSHALILFSIVAAVGCALASQYAVKSLIDSLGVGRSHPWLVERAFIVLVVLIFADNLFWRMGGWIAARAFVAVTGDIREDLFAYLVGHAPTYFADKQPGMLSSRVSATANAVYTAENTVAWNALPPCLAVVGAIGIVASVDPLMAAALVAVSLALATALFWFAHRGSAVHQTFATRAASVDGELVDVIGNMATVRAFGATWREHRRFDAYIELETTSRRRSLLYLERLRLMHAVVTAMLSAGLLGWVLWLWSDERATTGDVVLVSSLGFTILHGTRDLAVSLVDITQHVARLSEAVRTILAPRGLQEAADAVALQAEQPGIEFDDVTFAYPGRRPILDGFSLRIKAGERVGMIGPSGTGKTTVLALLQRFYEPQRGSIRIGSQDISKMTLNSLQDALAVVPQDVSLFHRSLLENLRYGQPDATEEQVHMAALHASCADLIASMPEGFDTIVGDRGAKLSGGQRQRIAIARAILKSAPILLLDEATSSLDSASESAIQAALERLMQGRTVLAIAHRVSTLQNFDRIVVVHRGRVIDEGSPAELASRPGMYHDVIAGQMQRATPRRRTEGDVIARRRAGRQPGMVERLGERNDI